MIKLDTSSKSYVALTNWAEDIVKFARINLGDKSRKRKNNRTGKYKARKIDSSGALRKSLDFKLNTNKNSISFQLSGLDYADVVDGGRKKGKGIPLKPLEKWIRKKPIKLRNKDNKFIKMTDKAVERFAGFVSFNAKKYGISPSHFLRDAIVTADNKHEQLFIDEITKDVAYNYELILKDLQKSSIKKRK